VLYKQDWDAVRQRYTAWLAGENDTPIVQVRAPKGPQTHGHTGWNFVHDTHNPELAFEAFDRYCRQTHFAGDAIPSLFVNLGPGIPAAYLGCPVDIRPDTVWFQDAGMTWEQILAARLDRNEKWWKYTLDVFRMAGQYAAGKFLVGMTDINAVLNIVGSLRGTLRLLADLVDEPEQVTKAADHALQLWLDCFDQLYAIAQQYQHGISNWMSIWGPGRFCDVQCDFSAMISPRMFEQFVVPHLRQQCRRLDWSIYHWDGPGQIPHLDLLLDIPELTGIQWVPGAGRPGTGSPQWFDLYKRIQARGKRLVLQGMAKIDVQRVVETFEPRGLLIEVGGCKSPEEADDLVHCVAGWAKHRS
jgi:hypothetical protein